MSADRLVALRRVPALALALAAPGLAAVALLGFGGWLAPEPTLAAGATVLVLGAFLAVRLALALDAAAAAIDGLDGGAPPDARTVRRIRRGLRPWAEALWIAAMRLARGRDARLQQAQARSAAAEAIIAAIPDPLILIDERRRIVRVNREAASFVGPLSEPRDLATALRNPAVLAAADAVLSEEGAHSVDFAVTAPVERQLRARFARLPHPSLDGTVVVLSLHDITALKRTEQMRADFIANASHELRTPLATLAGFIETLRGPAREDAEARERFLAIMQAQAARMTRLVEDLLSLSRIELNEHVVPTGRVALGPLLRQLAEALELRAGDRGIRIVLNLPPDLAAVVGERDELAQLFQNLIDNAIKYGRADSEITIGAENVTKALPEGGGERLPLVAVTVRDQGEGIARAHLPRLTERFYRIDTARSRELGGTGLGLAIVKHLVNRHRGVLDIESTPGVGSCFTVTLRQSIAPEPAIENPDMPRGAQSSQSLS